MIGLQRTTQVSDRIVLLVAQTAACANVQMKSLTRAWVLSQRVGDAMEILMYIGGGALLIIILLVLFLR